MRSFDQRVPFPVTERIIRSRTLLLFRACPAPRSPLPHNGFRFLRFATGCTEIQPQPPFRLAFPAWLLSWGSFPYSAINIVSPFYSSSDRSPFRRLLASMARNFSAFRVSHSLDGLLLTMSCQFISPDKHSWGSPSKAFPFHTAGPPLSFPCPLAVTSQGVSILFGRLQGLTPCESPLAVRDVSIN
jgi:hypothetical protein